MPCLLRKSKLCIHSQGCLHTVYLSRMYHASLNNFRMLTTKCLKNKSCDILNHLIMVTCYAKDMKWKRMHLGIQHSLSGCCSSLQFAFNGSILYVRWEWGQLESNPTTSVSIICSIFRLGRLAEHAYSFTETRCLKIDLKEFTNPLKHK